MENGNLRPRKLLPLLFLVSLSLNFSTSSFAQSNEIIFADQGAEWTPSIRSAFYTQDQGSRIMPLKWMQALKRSDGNGFLQDELTEYGYLSNPDTPGIPVGFTVAQHRGNASIGMTCAACHTRQIEVQGQKIRIDGGPGIVDFQSFLSSLDEAVGIIVNDSTAFTQFSESVIGAQATSTQKLELKQELDLWYLRFHTLMEAALPDIPWGPSRLDAVSMIFNRLAGLDIGEPPSYLIPENIAVADAPTRYPFLWNAARQDHTQWLGFSKNGNSLFGLARNLGEVYGVFAEFHPVKSNSIFREHNYLKNNSANFEGLEKVEDAIWLLGPPKWPWPLDQQLVEKGKEVFSRSNDAGGCVGCHGIKRGEIRFGKKSTWKTPIQNVGTDTRECEILNRTVKTGVLEGAKIPIVGDKLKSEDLVFNVLATAVVNTILQHGIFSSASESARASAAATTDEVELNSPYQDVESAFDVELFQTQLTSNVEEGCKYESRVMEGIWAAAPYLHNGSVSSLEELLKPANERALEFMIGTDYDIDSVGMAIEQSRFGYTLVTTGCDDINSGNSRCGHEFGTDLDPEEKRALIEYLKFL